MQLRDLVEFITASKRVTWLQASKYLLSTWRERV